MEAPVAARRTEPSSIHCSVVRLLDALPLEVGIDRLTGQPTCLDLQRPTLRPRSADEQGARPGRPADHRGDRSIDQPAGRPIDHLIGHPETGFAGAGAPGTRRVRWLAVPARCVARPAGALAGLPDLPELFPEGLSVGRPPERRASSRRGGREVEPEDMGRHATASRAANWGENAKNAPPANPDGAFLDRNPATSYSPRGSLPKYHRR